MTSWNYSDHICIARCLKASNMHCLFWWTKRLGGTKNSFAINEFFIPKGLGRRKPNAGAAQRYKDTSALLRWSSEPLFSPASSYQDDFISQSLPQTRITNEMEPVHTRRTYNLKRRQLRQTTKSAPLRTVPLLAWNIPDENTYAKPCVGTDRSFVPPKLPRESNSKLCRESISITSKSLEKSNNHHDISHVIETVTKLDL